MKITKKRLKDIILEEIHSFFNEKGVACPEPTQDLELNTKNRDAAIKAEHIQYGPLNLEDQDYYKKAAEHWNTDPEVAKKSNCGNCIAFDISPRMLDCLPGPVSEPIEDEEGKLGYCWMHHFKCHSARTCFTWAAGGPISEDKISEEWQEKNKGSLEEEVEQYQASDREDREEDAKELGITEKKDDRCTRIAKRKYDVWPSAYASGAVVRCRKGEIWKDLDEETDYSKEKESGLHGWFSRQGGKGKSKGWVDCNTCRKDKKTGRKTCKSCGRKEGEKRAKYPSCRPTPSACGTAGKGEKWGKKKNESMMEAVLEDGTLVCPVCLFELLEAAKCNCPDLVPEAEYQGRKVTLNKPIRTSGESKKFKVYVKDPKTGNIRIVRFGDPKMKIKKSNPKRRKSFRARHKCDNPGPKTKARYWSCRMWENVEEKKNLFKKAKIIPYNFDWDLMNE